MAAQQVRPPASWSWFFWRKRETELLSRWRPSSPASVSAPWSAATKERKMHLYFNEVWDVKSVCWVDLKNSPRSRGLSPPGKTCHYTPPAVWGSVSPCRRCWDALLGTWTGAALQSFHKSDSRGPTSPRSSHNARGWSPQELKSGSVSEWTMKGWSADAAGACSDFFNDSLLRFEFLGVNDR